ncbi:hypothetical protein Glove_54g34 [Diversispora epigaea]|uniref:Uncharacterized protein n=1 Tax=Diversispora epigaea TaxID=1348612 RepID=A0A397JDK8_9GLOM|nr:hypothetical protein Glove_54g34 [Diversispora epigaea]
MKKKAFQWYLKSAEGYNIKDEQKAFQWYLKLAEAELGNSDELNNLGIGTIEDEEKAFQWLFKPTEGGNNYGKYFLGCCYKNEIGTSKDEEKAFHSINELVDVIIQITHLGENAKEWEIWRWIDYSKFKDWLTNDIITKMKIQFANKAYDSELALMKKCWHKEWIEQLTVN